MTFIVNRSARGGALGRDNQVARSFLKTPCLIMLSLQVKDGVQPTMYSDQACDLSDCQKRAVDVRLGATASYCLIARPTVWA